MVPHFACRVADETSPFVGRLPHSLRFGVAGRPVNVCRPWNLIVMAGPCHPQLIPSVVQSRGRVAFAYRAKRP